MAVSTASTVPQPCPAEYQCRVLYAYVLAGGVLKVDSDGTVKSAARRLAHHMTTHVQTPPHRVAI